MTHSYVCHDSLICAPWLIHMYAMTHWYVCHDSVTRVPWLIPMWTQRKIHATRCSMSIDSTDMCTMTHYYVCHDSVTYVPWLIPMWTQRKIHGTRCRALYTATIKLYLYMSHGTYVTESFLYVPWYHIQSSLWDILPGGDMIPAHVGVVVGMEEVGMEEVVMAGAVCHSCLPHTAHVWLRRGTCMWVMARHT